MRSAVRRVALAESMDECGRLNDQEDYDPVARSPSRKVSLKDSKFLHSYNTHPTFLVRFPAWAWYTEWIISGIMLGLI